MRISPLCLFILIPSLTYAADGIPVKPGMWETTVTMSSPMLPQPHVTTKSTCVDRTEFSIDELMPNDNDGCTITESNVNGNTLSWKMECDMQGNKGQGGGEFTSKGNSGTGHMYMNVEAQGQSFSMETTWDGHRTGDC